MLSLSPEKERYLKEIYAPVTVGVPPADAVRGLCRMADGEIRFYGREPLPGGEAMRCCLFSKDNGLNWEKEFIPDPEVLGTMTFVPRSQEWITTVALTAAHCPWPSMAGMKYGTYAVVSKSGPGTTQKEFFYISENFYIFARQPIVLRSGRIIAVSEYYSNGDIKAPVVMYSDDEGRNWKESFPETLGRHIPVYPHKGERWQQYACEPTVEELSSGKLMMMLRTTLDHHYVSYSEDQGETWSKPLPFNCFYSCNTMPLLKRMSDGRLLFFWCNTQPLPELDHEKEQWGLPETQQNGRWEDVFTNRDANHAALSFDDGENWQGFREIALNAVRNVSDFRSFASGLTLDKSVHQFEALELPFGKILLAFGQAPASRRLVIFDPEWLLEKERKEDFYEGLDNVSTQVYVKSISGSHRSFSGHCSWNRTHGALLVPDPARDFTEVLQIVTPDDPRLFNRTQGAVWNFPAMKKGKVTLKVQIPGGPLRISLSDRWFNPCDDMVDYYAQLTMILEKVWCPAGRWTEIKIVFDLEKMSAVLFLDGVKKYHIPLRGKAPAGLSYLILQNTSAQTDFEGSLIKYMAASAAE